MELIHDLASRLGFTVLIATHERAVSERAGRVVELKDRVGPV